MAVRRGRRAGVAGRALPPVGVPVEGLEVGAEVGEAGEGELEGLEVAGVAAALGEAGGGAFDVADAFEGFAELGEEEGFGEEVFDELVAGGEFGEVAEGVEDPVAEEAGAHGGGGAVEDAKEGVPAVGVLAFDEVEVALGGGVDEDVVAAFPDGEEAEVAAVAAELVEEVVEDGAGGGDGGVFPGAAEAVEGLDAEVVLEEGGGVVGEEGVGVVGEGGGEGGEGGVFGEVAGVEEFGGGEAVEFVEEAGAVGVFGEGELAGGVVGAGKAPAFLFPAGDEVDGGEVVVAAVVEEVEVVDGAGGDDLADFALDDLAGLGLGGLLGDGDALAGLEEAGDVALGGVVGDAAHGDGVALGEGGVEDGGGLLGVLEEHFVEVAEAEEEEDVGGQGAAHGLILRHHGGELPGSFFRACHGGRLGEAGGSFQFGVGGFWEEDPAFSAEGQGMRPGKWESGILDLTGRWVCKSVPEVSDGKVSHGKAF